MKTLIIVIIILLCLLTTPLSLKRVIDRNKGKTGKGWPVPSDATRPDAQSGEDAWAQPGSAPSHAAGTAAAPAEARATAFGSASSSAAADLQSYLIRSIERIVKDSIRITKDDPAEAKFLMSFAAAARKAAAKRRQAEETGEHIPPFLIASITESCNLHCAGCYAHARPAEEFSQLTADDWDRIFTEAEELGISFIFLVGGEPLLRREVIETAGRHQNILFPIITNGLLIDDAYLELFDKCRNLLPVLSIEGEELQTDTRRGPGTYDLLQKIMQRLASLCIPFGVSVTVTTENLREVTRADFPDPLGAYGCRLVLYIEYVATGDADAALEPGEADRALMDLRLQDLRNAHEDMIFLSFPGDEKAFGGCLAAGRGFFHISAGGNAEPCPFAPFSDINLRSASLREVLQSDLFAQLDARGMLQDDHAGGCALSHKGNEIQALLGK